MNNKNKKNGIGETIIGLGLILAIFGVINSILIYNAEMDIQGILIYITVNILVLAIGSLVILVKLIKDIYYIEGRIYAILEEIKKSN